MRFTPIAPIVTNDENLRSLHETMRTADESWRGAMAHGLPDEVVRELIADYISASNAYQKAKFGRVRVPLTVAAIMRGGWRP